MPKDESRYDMLAHLEAALAEWTTQIAQAHLTLAEQVSDARDQFASEFSDDVDEGGVFTEVQSGIDEVTRVLADPTATPGTASTHIASLRNAISNLYAELRTLRVQEAVPQASEQYANVVQERDAAREELATLQARINALDEKAREKDRRSKDTIAAKAFDASGHKRRMGDILVDAGVITHAQLMEALQEQRNNPQRPLGAIFVDNGYTSEDVVAQVLASQLQLAFVRIAREPVDINAIGLLSATLAHRHLLVPIRATPEKVVLAMANPLDLVALDDVERATGRYVEASVATASDVSRAIVRYYGAS